MSITAISIITCIVMSIHHLFAIFTRFRLSMNYGMSTEKANMILLRCDEFMIVYKTLKYGGGGNLRFVWKICNAIISFLPRIFAFFSGWEFEIENIKHCHFLLQFQIKSGLYIDWICYINGGKYDWWNILFLQSSTKIFFFFEPKCSNYNRFLSSLARF